MNLSILSRKSATYVVVLLGLAVGLFSCDPAQTLVLRNELEQEICFKDLAANCQPLQNIFGSDSISLPLRIGAKSDTVLMFGIGIWLEGQALEMENCLKTTALTGCEANQLPAIQYDVEQEGYGGSILIITLSEEQ